MKKAIIFMLVSLFSVSHFADAEEINLPDGKWWQLPMIAHDIGLTGEEQKKLDELFVENRRKMIDLKAGVVKEKFELEQVLDKPNLDEAICLERFKKLQSARTNLAAEQFRFLIEARKILGTDRYQKLTAKFQERKMKQIMRGQGEFKDSFKRRLLDN